MWKKLKGGRRQILQLEEKKPPKAPSKPKGKHSIHYNDDDDSKKSNESDPSPLPAVNKDATPLDSQIADFFKEIDAMTVPEGVQKTEKSTTFSETETVTQSITGECTSEPAVNLPPSIPKDSNQRDGQNRGDYCVWQEIHDSSTGYNYYWNVQTNQVTWDCPAEYTNYIQSINASNSKKEVTQEAVNSDEKNKLEKEKNNNFMKNEGPVVPISYYRKSSSSDESSDTENALLKSNKKQNLMKIIEGKKSKGILKVDAKSKSTSDNALSDEMIGPLLPPKFQLPQTISGAKQGNPETIASKSKNEKNIKIDPVLPLKATIEKSSQSNLKEFLAESSQATSCKISLKDNERKRQKVHEQTSDESPYFTEKRTEDSLGHSINKANNNTYGFRPVVEYDSFTDEDEDINFSNISSSKQFTDEKCLKVKPFIQQNIDTLSKSSAFLSSTGKETSSFKRKDTSCFEENTKKDGIKKPSRNTIDIDSIFTAHTSHGKYGFGWQNQPNAANAQSHATSPQYRKTHVSKNDYKVNFIKSDVLDFRALNDKDICDKMNSVSKDEIIQKSICEPIKNAETKEEKCKVKKTVEVVEKSFVMNDMQKTLSENIVGSSSSIALLKDKYRNIKNKRKKDGNFANKVGLASISIEEDLDEIDRALCEALDAKKAAKNSVPKPPSPSPTIQDHLKNIIAATSLTMSHDKNVATEITVAHLPPGPLMDKILEASSNLIDKLTFLLSAQSTATSFSGLFVQLQTRFLDWQAGGLESEYFMTRLKEAEQYIQQYEMSCVSGEWMCQWDRVNKRYFYINRRTQQSQWTFPEEINSSQKSSWVQSQIIAGSSTASDGKTGQNDIQTVSSSSSMPENVVKKSTTTSFVLDPKDIASVARWILKSSPPPPPPGIESPPPPPPISPPPKSPPPPPPDSTAKEILGEPEDMDIEDSNDSNPILFVNNMAMSEDRRMQYSSMVEPSSLRSLTTFPNSSIFNVASSTSASSFEVKNATSSWIEK